VKARLFAPENRKWWTLTAVAFGLFMIMLDNTVVNVALPSIQRSLHLKISELEWVVAGYALTFGALMLTGGKLADLFGRRLAFVVGLAIFTGSSLACGLAGSATLLIGARVVQGVGAALMNPATLSIITVTFPPRQRGTAIGIWAGVSALALAIGPLVGGLIAQRINWNWIFFINIPVGLLAIAAAYAFIDESRDTSREQKPDVSGLFTSALGLFALSYALIESNNYGWTSGRILGAFAVAAVALTTFILVELHQRLPMLELGLFRNRVFAGANTVMLLVGLAMFGVFFYVSLYLQQVLDYSPTQAGASFLPMTALIVVLAPIAGKLSDRIGPRPLVTTGLVLLSGSLLFFGRMDIHTTFWGLLPAMLLGGVGMATAMAPVTAAAMGSVRPDKAGVGSAVLNSMRQVGGSLGIALMGAIVASPKIS
jgi:EmrB/QacA subfamily drug resistance transporter